MTAMATEASATAYALANKRQSDAMGARVLATSGKGWTFVKSVPSRFKASTSRLLKTFKLDAAAGAVWGTVRGIAARANRYARSALAWVGQALGWKSLGLYALTDTSTRKQALNVAAKTVLTVSRRVAWLETKVLRLPFIGEKASHALSITRIFTVKHITRVLDIADRSADKASKHEVGGMVIRLANRGSLIAMTRKAANHFLGGISRRWTFFGVGLAAAMSVGYAVYAKYTAKDVEAEKREIVETAQAQGFTVVELDGTETKAEREQKLASAAATAEASRKASEKAGLLPGSASQQVKKQSTRR
jgi:hypothetical protein